MENLVAYPLRIDRQLWKAFVRQAQRNNRTIAGELRQLIKEAVSVDAMLADPPFAVEGESNAT